MSKVDLNPLVSGFSGKIGNAVMRRRGDKTYMSSRPKPRTRELSEKEAAHRERFRRATIYAKGIVASIEAKAPYEQAAKSRNLSAFVVAVTDYLKSPVVEAVNTSRYTGKVGDTVIVRATDDFKVESVRVTITAADGSVNESGMAIQDLISQEWTYLATQANAFIAGTTIKAVATDKPGNEAEMEVTL